MLGAEVDVQTRVEEDVRSSDFGRPTTEFSERKVVVADANTTTGRAPLLFTDEDGSPLLGEPRWRERLVFGTARQLWRHRVFAAVVILLTASGGFVAARTRSPYFIARATIFPPPMDGSIGGIGLASVAGLVGNLGLNTGDASLFPLYETFTFSRTILADLLNLRLDDVGYNGTLLQRFQLGSGDANQLLEAGMDKVSKRLRFDVDKKTGVVTISYLDSNPNIAAEVVNHVVDALNHLDVQTATRRAGEKRQFIEKRMNESARTLANAESQLEEFRQQNLRIGNSPELLLDQARLERELDIEQQIYLTLRREYELARIDEERSVPVVNVLDRAVPPVAPAGPSLLKFTAAAGFLGACLVVGTLALVALQPRRTVDELLQTARLR
jgi:uncharacterized protein involved in exopolysaccharide biosynthesis